MEKNRWGQALFIIFPLQNFGVFPLDEGQVGKKKKKTIVLFFSDKPQPLLGTGAKALTP